MEVYYDVKAEYDKNAYRALSEASWQLFVKRRNMVVAYPVFAAMILIIGVYLFVSRNTIPSYMMYGGLGMIAFVIAVIPLSSITSRAKMTYRAVKEAKKTGRFPLKVRFRFCKNEIRGDVAGTKNEVTYKDVDIFAILGDWRFLFFGQAAYIFHVKDLGDGKNIGDLDAFLERSTGSKPVILRGKGPER